MRKSHFILAAMLATAIAAMGETQFNISGLVRARDTNSQLIGAKVRVYDSADSLLSESIAEARTGDLRGVISKMARFWLEIPKVKGLYRMEISYEDFDTLEQTVDLRNIGRREFSRDLGTIYLERTRHEQLHEISVTASKVKFYNRGDTVVYNADAFRLAEGSMLDALIRQLPGVELRDGGRIYVNGEFVETLLLNGRDFFKGDNNLMLDNLAAYTVKDIEVYRRQDFKAEALNLTGREDTQLVMDVKLKKEYMGGWTINAEAGGGTDKRYLARIFALHFTGTNQVSLVANINNLNDASKINGEASWDPATHPEGTQTYREVGINYTLANTAGNRELNGQILLRSTDVDMATLTNATNFLPTLNTYGHTLSNSNHRNLFFKTLQIFDLKNDSWALRVMPRFQYTRTRDESASRSASLASEQPTDDMGARIDRILSGHATAEDRRDLINASLNEVYSGDYVAMPGIDVVPTFKVPRTSDRIYLQLSYSHRSHHSWDNSIYAIDYGRSSIMPQWRRQQNVQRPDRKDAFYGEAEYHYAVNDNMRLSLGYDVDMYRQRVNSNFWLGYLESENSGDYTLDNLNKVALQLDPANSYYSTENICTQNVSATMRWSSDNWYAFVNVPLNITNNSLDYDNSGVMRRARFAKTQLGDGIAMISYQANKPSGRMSCDIYYRISQKAPSLISMIDVPNTINPLNVSLGNADLTNSTTQSITTMWSLRQRGERSSYASAEVSFTDNALAHGYTYDTATGVRYYRWYNIDGNITVSTSAGHQRNLCRNLSISLDANYNFNRANNMVGENSLEASRTTMYTNMLSGQAAINYTPSSRVTLSVSASPNYQHSHSARASRGSLSFMNCTYSARCVLTLPYDWSIRTNLDYYTRSGYNDPELDKDDPIWNARVAKTFGGGRWVVAIDAYDMLHRMRNVSYTVTPDCRIEKFTNTIPRYVLLHVQYRVNIQPKKKIAQTTVGSWR